MNEVRHHNHSTYLDGIKETRRDHRLDPRECQLVLPQRRQHLPHMMPQRPQVDPSAYWEVFMSLALHPFAALCLDILRGLGADLDDIGGTWGQGGDAIG